MRLLTTVLLLLAAQTALAAVAERPCAAPEYRQFDFWVGAWDVYNPQGQTVGANRITVEQGGCVLHEHWTGAKGGTGESFNIYDRARGAWHQTWVSAQGVLLLLEGGLNEAGEMVLSGSSLSRTGTVLNRITWTPHADGSVRQHWEVSGDGGEQWRTVFDGLYRRQQQAAN